MGKHHLTPDILGLAEALFLALAILGFALHQLVTNPASALVLAFWFMFIGALAVIVTSAVLMIWSLLPLQQHPDNNGADINGESMLRH